MILTKYVFDLGVRLTEFYVTVESVTLRFYCSCRVENILTLGKWLRLWFCFLLHSILFFISQTSYRTYKIISSYELARPIMGTIFLVIIIIMNKSQELTIFHGRQKFTSTKN